MLNQQYVAIARTLRARLRLNVGDERVVDSELLKCLLELEIPSLMHQPAWRTLGAEEYRGPENGHNSASPNWVSRISSAKEMVDASRS